MNLIDTAVGEHSTVAITGPAILRIRLGNARCMRVRQEIQPHRINDCARSPLAKLSIMRGVQLLLPPRHRREFLVALRNTN